MIRRRVRFGTSRRGFNSGFDKLLSGKSLEVLPSPTMAARLAIRAAFAICIALVLGVISGCEGDKDGKSKLAGKASGYNVLFVTLDTTRADHIGCYGYKGAETPTLDAVAARGVLFENAFSNVPLTLPAHVSMLTGRYPREHGLRDNGLNALSEKFPTLATLFKQHGYSTGAFVASFVLDKRFGLQRGFDTYNDDMGEVSYETQPLEWQIEGNTITDRALSWLNSVKGKPFFGWVHYYDAHDPHMAPAGFAKEGRKPYDSELAYIDAQIKRLTDWLAANGLSERTLIVVAGDHGESFGEHGEFGHTTFLFETNLHIPLIFTAPKLIPSGKRVGALVGQVDVFPTTLELFGWEAPPKLNSRSLVAALGGESMDDEEVYSESLYALLAFNWSEQRSLTTRDWKYISSAKPQLYDRKNDPQEMNNLISEKAAVALRLEKALRKQYDGVIPGKAEAAKMDEKSRQKMQSLGYAGGNSNALEVEQFRTEGLADPRDNMQLLTQFQEAMEMLKRAKKPDEIREVLPRLEHIVEQSPNSAYFRKTAGGAYLQVNDYERALEHLQKAQKMNSTDASTFADAARALRGLGKMEEAEKHFKLAFALQDSNAAAHSQYGDMLASLNRLDEAEAEFRKAISVFPTFASAHVGLGNILRRKGRLAEAVQAVQEAKRLKGDLATADVEMGVILTKQERMDDALREFREGARKSPENGDAWLNLGQALIVKKDFHGAEEALRKAMEISGFEADASFALAVVMKERSNKVEMAKLLEKAIELKPTLTIAVEELAQYYINAKNPQDAVRILGRGVENTPNGAKMSFMLAHVLATASDEKLRDGPRAVTLAEHAAKLTNFEEPFVLQTVAESYAEAGQFEKAIKTAEDALEKAQRMNRPALVSTLKEQLEGYRVGRAYRDPRFE